MKIEKLYRTTKRFIRPPKRRTFWQWLFFIKPKEEYYYSDSVVTTEYQNITEILNAFAGCSRGKSIGMCSLCLDKKKYFFWIDIGKNKIAIQTYNYGEERTAEDLLALESMFDKDQDGNPLPVIVGKKKYKIVFNVIDSLKQSLAHVRKN